MYIAVFFTLHSLDQQAFDKNKHVCCSMSARCRRRRRNARWIIAAWLWRKIFTHLHPWGCRGRSWTWSRPLAVWGRSGAPGPQYHCWVGLSPYCCRRCRRRRRPRLCGCLPAAAPVAQAASRQLPLVDRAAHSALLAHWRCYLPAPMFPATSTVILSNSSPNSGPMECQNNWEAGEGGCQNMIKTSQNKEGQKFF